MAEIAELANISAVRSILFFSDWVTEAVADAAGSSNGRVSENRSGAALRQSKLLPSLGTRTTNKGRGTTWIFFTECLLHYFNRNSTIPAELQVNLQDDCRCGR